MTTKELRAYIDRTLGNSIRCLLPSYWWKKLFGLVVDKVESAEQGINRLSKKIKEVESNQQESSVVVVEWDGMETTQSQYNKEAYASIKTCLENGKNIVVEVLLNATHTANVHYVAESFNIRKELDGTYLAWIRVVIATNGGVGESRERYYFFTLSEDGTLKVSKIENIYDETMSDSSTNAPQNKAVMEAIKNVVPTFGITKTQGFAEYFSALAANQNIPNMYPRGIVLYEDSQSEVDNVISLNNRTDVGIEFSVADKRYRWVFNKASGAFIREEEVSSESSSGIPIYVALQGAMLTDEQIAANKYALENKYKEIPYAVYIINSNGENYTIKYPIVQWGGNVFYVTDWDDGNPFSLLKHTMNSDGSVTYEGRVQADSEMSDTSTNPVQNKVIKEYVDNAVQNVEIDIDTEVSSESTNPVQNKVVKEYIDNAILNVEIDVDNVLSDTSTNPVQNKVVKEEIDKKADKTYVDNEVIKLESEITELENELITDEEIYAAALTDLDSRLININESISTEITTRETLSEEFQTFKTSVTENEEVWATSLTDINDRITANYNYGETTYSTKTELQTEVEVINTTLVENEEVIAATLNDLNAQIAALNVIISELTTRIETLENA